MSTRIQDEQLVERIIHRDEKALRSLFDTYHKQLHNYVHRQLRDSALADEIVQDVFIDFLEGLRDFRFQSSVKTFLFTIARNKTIDFIRKKKIKKVMYSALPSYVVEGLSRVVIDDELEKKELEYKMEKVFEELPHDYQVILRLKYMEDTSVKTISEKLSLPFKATESLLFRARKAFVKVFNQIP